MIDAASTSTIIATLHCPLPPENRLSTSSEWKQYVEYCAQLTTQLQNARHCFGKAVIASNCPHTIELLERLYAKHSSHWHLFKCDVAQSDLADLMYLAEATNVSGEVLFCDGTYSIDILQFAARAQQDNLDSDVILSGDILRRSDLKGLFVAATNDSGTVSQLVQNRLPDCDGSFRFLNGCYLIRDFGDVYSEFNSNRTQKLGVVTSALIQGSHQVSLIETPTLSTSTFRMTALRGAVFCDIDGTIVTHEDVPSYDSAIEVLPGSRETLKAWRDQGKEIILVTARNAADEMLLRSALKHADIPYDRLVMGLPSGPRHLINDRKPSAVSVPQAVAHEIRRNEGVAHLTVDSSENEYYLRRFPGGSYAETFLVERDQQQFVRKRVSKKIAGDLGHGRLRDQYQTLQRFASLSRESTPRLLGERDSSLEYYFDMEYLSSHEPLSELNQHDQEETIRGTVALLFEDVYRPTHLHTNGGSDWFKKHLNVKIYPKTRSLIEEPGLMEIIGPRQLHVNGTCYLGLNGLVKQIVSGRKLYQLTPRSLSLVHGDLTGENILCSGDDIRLIDMDGGGETEPGELDLGKLFQSLIARYETWSGMTEKLVQPSNNGFRVEDIGGCRLPVVERLVREWAALSGGDPVETYRRGLFFMSLHLIRMAPFRLRVSVDQARFALISAVRWLSYCVEDRDEISLPTFAQGTAE